MEPPLMAGKVAAQATPGLASERMSQVDLAWLRMDSPENLMMILGVWLLKPGVSHRAVCQRVAERLLRYPRFGQRVVPDAAGATWVTDLDFRVERHVLVEPLTASAPGLEQQALQDRVAELAVQPLDPRHPLWQFHLVEHYQGGSALIVRLHHCIADGLALVAVMQSLADGGAAPAPDSAPPAGHADAPDWRVDRVIKPFTAAAVKALAVAGDGIANALALLVEPQKGLEKSWAGSVGLARIAGQLLGDAAALALMPDDAPTRLKGLPGPRKRVAWRPPLPLADVKAVATAWNCSLNDVVLSCVAGAIGHYLKSLGDQVADLEIRVMMPVNLRTPADADQLGNRFGLAPLLLPLGLANPVERLLEVRRRMRALKNSRQPLLAWGLLALAGLLVKPAQDALLRLFARKTTAVVTNVPGPRNKLRFCGASLLQSPVWVPQASTVGVGVSIFSYAGGVQLGLISDAALCPQPQHILDQVEPEFAKLAMVSLMLPWGESGP